MSLHILFYTGILFLLSQASGRLAQRFKAPRLVGYLLAGILIGPSVLKLFSASLVQDQFAVVTEIALAMIAFSIGGSLRREKLRDLKGAILWITLLQAFCAFALVLGVMCFVMPFFLDSASRAQPLLKSFLPIAIIIGAISAATAPAAILSIIQEYKSKGPFTTVLLGLVALDDALVLIFFSFASVAAKNLISGDLMLWQDAILIPVAKIAAALFLGFVAGFVLRKAVSYFHHRDTVLGVVIGSVLLTSGLALSFGLSALLANMVLGFYVANHIRHRRSDEIFGVIRDIEEPIFGAFFLLAGTHLDLHLARAVLGLAFILILVRYAGKLIGAYTGAVIGKAPSSVRKYIGLALLPTAGVTIGLALEAYHNFSPSLPILSETMLNIIVGATLINELTAPFAVRYSLSRAGEIHT
ncbi:MAG: cation:proton antiporter [Candidatus Omnitrophica bacterium]|nr:cation:proton antiporter [Candidatus Omnitrophota bacterium]